MQIRARPQGPLWVVLLLLASWMPLGSICADEGESAAPVSRAEALERAAALMKRVNAEVSKVPNPERVPFLREAAASVRSWLGKESAETGDHLLQLAEIARRRGRDKGRRFEQALLEEVLAIRIASHGERSEKTAAVLRRLAYFHYEKNPDAAISNFERALAALRHALGDEHERTIQLQVSFGHFLVRIEQFERGRAVLTDALVRARKALGVHYATAGALNILGGMERRLGNHREARQHLEGSLALLEEGTLKDPFIRQDTICDLGEVAAEMGDEAGAEAYFEKLRAYQKELAANARRGSGGIPYAPRAELRALRFLVPLYERRNELARAAPLRVRLDRLEEATKPTPHKRPKFTFTVGTARIETKAEQAKRIRAEKLIASAQAEIRRGKSLRLEGRLTQARVHFEKALTLEIEARGPSHPEVAEMHARLQGLLRASGDIAAAIRHGEAALEIRTKELGPKHAITIETLSNLAFVYAEAGSHGEARRLSERALKLRTESLGPLDRQTAQSLNNHGGLLMMAGDTDGAGPYLRRALAVRRSGLGEHDTDTLQSLENLGALHLVRGELDAAQTHIEEALALRRKVMGASHVTTALSLGNMAVLRSAQGRYEEAVRYEQDALAIRGALDTPPQELARSRNNLGAFLLELEAWDEARTHLEAARTIRVRTFGEAHPSSTGSLLTLGVLASRRGDTDLARTQMEKALEHMRTYLLRVGSVVSLSSQLKLARTLRWQLDAWVDHSHAWPEHSYEPVFRMKGLLARAMALDLRLARRLPPALKQKRQALQAAHRRISALVNDVPFGKEARQAWQRFYAEALIEQERLADELGAAFAPFRDERVRLDLRVADIRSRLGEDEVLVDMLRTPERYVAWIVGPTGPIQLIELGASEQVDSLAQAFATACAEEEGPEGARRRQEASKTFHGRVFRRIEEQLPEGTRAVFLCADGALTSVPFAALPSGDRLRFVRLAFATDLRRPAASTRPTSALVVGGVDYEQSKAPAPKEGGTSRGASPRGGRHFLYLRGSLEEARWIAKRFGDGALLSVGAEATEVRLRREAKGKGLLHLATHGFVRKNLRRALRPRRGRTRWLGAQLEERLTGWDPMMLVGLAMAGANQRDGGAGDDGVLTAREVSHLDLESCELVVLSACKSALGKVESGEGVLGLVRGFRMAGASAAIASLWPVDDAATRKLMEHFYDVWLVGKVSAAEALRSAQERLRRDAKWATPRYWAAFVVYAR